LLLRTLCGVGTPRALQGRFGRPFTITVVVHPETIWTHTWDPVSTIGVAQMLTVAVAM